MAEHEPGNNLIQILEFQNQIAVLKKRLEPFINDNPYHPEIVKLRIDIAYLEGKLEVSLEIQEVLQTK